MNGVEINLEVQVNPTEDVEKVKKAVMNIIYNARIKVIRRGRMETLTGKAESIDSLTQLRDLLKRERIGAAARRELSRGLGDKSVTFYLNKQVAYAGHVSFSNPVDESPLGSIKLQIFCDNPKAFIEWLTT
jgi:predicted RNA binding protein with dsRBD fold (UPF0201 family)